MERKYRESVFEVVEGDSYERNTIGMYTSLEMAEDMVRILSANDKDNEIHYDSSRYSVHEVPLNVGVHELRAGKKLYRVEVPLSGGIIVVSEQQLYFVCQYARHVKLDGRSDYKEYVDVMCFAKNEDDARKIAALARQEVLRRKVEQIWHDDMRDIEASVEPLEKPVVI